MKRALALFMVLTMVMCAVAACGGTGNTPTTAPDAGTSVSTTVESTTVTTVQTTATTKKPSTPAGPTVAEQDVNSPSETAGKAPILWLDFETHNIENGINLPSMTVFFYICEYFNITPYEFFDNNMHDPQTSALRLLALRRCSGVSRSPPLPD